jgi:hypothetical protein
MTIPLIDKSDNFQIIRSKIAEILSAEILLQQVLATAEGKDPDDWKFRVYLERIKPWEVFLNGTDPTPIVNVWYERGNSEEGGRSNISTKQNWTSRFNLDVYAYATSGSTSGGHSPGDQTVALKAHNVAMLVRNIIMHDDYCVLKLTGSEKPLKRWVPEMTPFQPQSGGQVIQNILGMRVVLEVNHDETILQGDEEICEGIDIVFKHEPDGIVIAEMTIGEPEDPEEP